MVLDFYNAMIAFVEAQPILVALVVAVMEFLKIPLEQFTWVQKWHKTVLAFVIAFIFAIPSSGFVGIDVFNYIASGFGLGLVATGLYKTFKSVSG